MKRICPVVIKAKHDCSEMGKNGVLTKGHIEQPSKKNTCIVEVPRDKNKPLQGSKAKRF